MKWKQFESFYLSKEIVYTLYSVFFCALLTQRDIFIAFLAAPANLTAEEIEQKWQDLASDLSALLQGHGGEIPESVVPFDAASEIPVDEQKWVTTLSLITL